PVFARFEAGQIFGSNLDTSPPTGGGALRWAMGVAIGENGNGRPELVGADEFIVGASRLQPAKNRPPPHAQNPVGFVCIEALSTAGASQLSGELLTNVRPTSRAPIWSPLGP